MFYDNEITILFNVVNTKTKQILGESFVPHVLRIPKEIITKDVDDFLETYEPLLSYLKKVCTTYEDWKYATVEYYNVQEDIFENVYINKVIKIPEDINKYTERKIIEILEGCLSKFNMINVYTKDTFSETLETIVQALTTKGMSKTSVMLYILSKAQETEDTEVIEIIQKITNL